MSAIKPINSGSVSLADAIQKARGIAAEKAARADDPRSASRAYRRSRSRSRSPPRRDQFRDNYNPYRDERREDPRRVQNGRDISYSPNQQAFPQQQQQHQLQQFNRSYEDRARSDSTRPDSNTEVITVESSAVGLIIGRAGENMRRIEQESGARVQFISGPENSGPLRQCKVTGTPRQRADAKSEIFRVAQDNPKASQPPPMAHVPMPIADDNANQPALREGEKSIQIMVPDRTVGLIIGRGGETIRDLQERSGCHVNIVGENKSINGLRPVNLIGTREAAARAKDLIMEVVDSDTRGNNAAQAGATPALQITQMPPQMPQAPQGYPPYDPYGAQQYDPYAAASVAPPAAVPAPSAKVNDSLMVPSEAVGMIIGKGGETIKDMQSQSSCKINVSQPSGADIQRHIELIGTRMSIDTAKRLIWEKVTTVVSLPQLCITCKYLVLTI